MNLTMQQISLGKSFIDQPRAGPNEEWLYCSPKRNGDRKFWPERHRYWPAFSKSRRPSTKHFARKVWSIIWHEIIVVWKPITLEEDADIVRISRSTEEHVSVPKYEFLIHWWMKKLQSHHILFVTSLGRIAVWFLTDEFQAIQRF